MLSQELTLPLPTTVLPVTKVFTPILRKPVILAIPQITATPPIQNTLRHNFLPTVHPVIRSQPGYLLPLTMIRNIFLFTVASTKANGHYVQNVIPQQQIILHLAASSAMSTTAEIGRAHV